MIAALFVRADSHYKTMPGVDAWDAQRDATRWPGGCPAVYHPPCRAWGQYKQWAKPRPGERELSLWAIERVRRFGGVLEHPKASELWKVAGCVTPGVRDQHGGVLVFVNQGDWGHRAQKPTGLYIVGAPVPDLMHGREAGRGWVPVENMGVKEREATPAPFAELLVGIARSVEQRAAA